MSTTNLRFEIEALIDQVKTCDETKQFTQAQSYRRLIESKLAAKIIAKPTDALLNVVNQVSESLIQLVQHHEKEIQNDPKLNMLLKEVVKGLHHEEAFGRLVLSESETLENKSTIALITNILKNNEDLPLVMHLHALLGQHLVRPLLDLPIPIKQDNQSFAKDTLASLAAKLIEKTPHLREALRKKFYLYENEGRGRHEINTVAPKTTAIGIVSDNMYAVGDYYSDHVRAADRFLPDVQHPYYQQYIENSSLPFVAGPSGHAGILFRTATMTAHLSANDMKQYALAAMAMIVGGGMHSTHEIMLMFKQLGFHYETGDYREILDLLDERNITEEISGYKNFSPYYTERKYNISKLDEAATSVKPPAFDAFHATLR